MISILDLIDKFNNALAATRWASTLYESLSTFKKNSIPFKYKICGLN